MCLPFRGKLLPCPTTKQKFVLGEKHVSCNKAITFPSTEKTGRKPCSSREHMIGIVMVSERDFDIVTCVLSSTVYAL